MEALLVTMILHRWPWDPPHAVTTDTAGTVYEQVSQRYDWWHFWRREWICVWRAQTVKPEQL